MISRRNFLASAGAIASLGNQQTLAKGVQPNIVYVLADDLGWGDLRCYNAESGIPTPFADGLGRQGMRWTDMHSPSAVCSPTRYGILTGRYCWRSRLKEGVLWGDSPNLIEKGRLTVPALLRAHGYYTAGVGKWHLGLGSAQHTNYDKTLNPGPLNHGFDYYFGIPASLDMEPYVFFENDRVIESATAITEGKTQPRGVFWRPGPIAPHFNMTEVLPTLTDKAVSLIRERAKDAKRQPFFLYVPLSGPHTPWVPKPEFQGKSQAGLYGDFVVQVDNSLGRILRAVEEGGIADNTLFIFTSDNGADWKVEDKERFAHRANANWRGEKADIWDAGHRIPFVARWPGYIQAGSVTAQLGCLTDLMSTVASIVGTSLPRNAGEDSFDLLPTLRGSTSPKSRDAIVHHSSLGMFSIRRGSWKLELGLGSGGFSDPKTLKAEPGGPAGQLYNLATDPGESDNLYLKFPSKVRELYELLTRYRDQGFSRPM